jgi:hypothetical protein
VIDWHTSSSLYPIVVPCFHQREEEAFIMARTIVAGRRPEINTKDMCGS